jgi:hypothetical protein
VKTAEKRRIIDATFNRISNEPKELRLFFCSSIKNNKNYKFKYPELKLKNNSTISRSAKS